MLGRCPTVPERRLARVAKNTSRVSPTLRVPETVDRRVAETADNRNAEGISSESVAETQL